MKQEWCKAGHFLQNDRDAANYCLGWDSRYTRNCIPLWEGAVIKDGGTEQFASYLLVSPECRLSLAISATNDGRVWWLPVLEEIGGEALKVLEEDRKSLEIVKVQEGENTKQENAELWVEENEGLEQVQYTNSMPERNDVAMIHAHICEEFQNTEIPENVARQYRSLAYGSNCAYRFTIDQQKLIAERYVRGEGWKLAEEFKDFTWNGTCFANPNGGTLQIEEIDGKIYYIRGEMAFCQKNSSYASRERAGRSVLTGSISDDDKPCTWKGASGTNK